MKRFGRVILGAVPITFAAVAVALAQDKSDVRGERPVIRVGPETSVRGITVEEYFDRQQQLHARLTAELPDGTLAAPIRVELTQQDLADLAAPFTRPPLRIGVVKSITPVNVAGLQRGQQNGVLQETKDGGFVWATTISSPGAHGIRVHFRNFSIPAGAEMYIFNLEGEAHGPYLGQGLNGNGDFWTNTVFSDTAVILLRHVGPADAPVRANVSFVIDSVGHIGRRFPAPGPQGHNWAHDQCGNANCVLDATCPTTDAPAVPAKDAVAKMEWIQGAFIFTCTGGLIADTDTSTQRNLFLTANHCLSKNNNASNMETFFFFTTSACNGNCPGNPAPSTIGATVLKTSRNGDFTLLELDQDPPAGTTFLGFNNSPIAFTNGADLYRISNPNFGPQVFSHHQVDTGTGTCNTLPRGEFIYSADHHGATDGGSSGAPVVNSVSEIVGQLFGCCGFGCEVCVGAPTNATVDGALAFYFDQVAEFLDPSPCVPTTEVCDNGVDDDCDGDVDCDDADCTGDPACEGCALGQKNDPCNTGADCCSGRCKRNGTCR